MESWDYVCNMLPNGQTRIGSLIRLPLRLIPRQAVVPVLSGQLRGAKWIVGSSIHGCWLGIYERGKQREVAGLIRPGDIVYDVGAQAGFYSLLASRLVGQTGLVYAFEPLPRNLSFLRSHLALNSINNTQVVASAVSDHDGELSFKEGLNPLQGRLSESGTLTVSSVRLDSLQDKIRPPSLIKIDIEGGGLPAVRGALQTLKTHRPIVFLAIDAESDWKACEILEQIGYRIREFSSNEIAAIPA